VRVDPIEVPSPLPLCLSGADRQVLLDRQRSEDATALRADECLEGASVALIDAKGKKVAALTTDEFGDFWFERQEPGQYSLRIEKAGYGPKTIEPIDALKDVNVGDIELHQPAAR
jgi:hypothetical protein